MGPGVGMGEGHSMRRAFLEEELEAVVRRGGVAELVSDASEHCAAISSVLGVVQVVHSSVRIIGSRGIGRVQARVDVAAVFRLLSLAAHIRGGAPPVRAELALNLETILE